MRGFVVVTVALALTAQAAAATFVVNSTLDTDDKSADGLCRDANNKCTLRAAVTEANRDAAADVIEFGITGTGAKTITLVSTPPGAAPTPLSIIHPVTINATTQNGYAAGAPVVEIDGSAMGTTAFVVSAPGCEIRGLRIKQFSAAAVSLTGTATCVIRANHFVNNLVGIEAQAAAATGTTLVGGALAADRNVFSTNTSAIVVTNGAHDVQIIGNFIGTDVTGMIGAGNSSYGVYLDTASAEIRNNVIAGGTFGVATYATNGPMVVADNLIGTNAAGTVAFSNSIGVDVHGGMTQITGNTIVGSNTDGIRLTGSQCVGTIIRGNRIGTNAAGLPLGNSSGIWIDDNATASIIGGTLASERNVISGNSWGVVLSSSQSTFDLATQTRDHTIVGNFIGILSDGTPRPNQVGVWIGNAAKNHVDDNTISGNSSAGVVVAGFVAKDNSIRRNSIFDNGGLGIDLDNNNVTPNDPFDGDTGANDLQNYPLVAVGSDATTTWVGGTFNSTPSSTFAIDMFSSPSCASGSNAKQYLGSTAISTDINGNATLQVPFARMPDGTGITATATSASGATSELSGCATVSACTPFDVVPLMDASVGIQYFTFLQGATAGIQHVEVVGGALPTGFTLLPDGELSGIPQTPGTFSFTVRITDTRGCITTQELTLRVCPLIDIKPEGLQPVAPYTPISVQLTASGGTPPYTFVTELNQFPDAAPAPELLPGVELSASGLLAGTPTQIGYYSFTVSAIDQSSCKGSRPYGLDVGCQAMALLPLNIPVGDLGAPYHLEFTATGGVAPYRFVASGLPPGLEFSREGLLAGTPRARGVTDITITVTDGVGCQRQVSYTLVVDVSNPPGCDCGAGGRPSSLIVVGFVVVVTLRRRRRATA
jgi:CSLREA domain-containing protein